MQGPGQCLHGAGADPLENPEVLELQDAEVLEPRQEGEGGLGPVEVQAHGGDAGAVLKQLPEKRLEVADLFHFGQALLVRAVLVLGLEADPQGLQLCESPVQAQLAQVSAVDALQELGQELHPPVLLVSQVEAGPEYE